MLDEKQFNEIRDDIKKAIKSALEDLRQITPKKRWVSSLGAAEILNIKVRTLYFYCQKRKLHPRKVGGILLFDRFEIESLIEGS